MAASKITRASKMLALSVAVKPIAIAMAKINNGKYHVIDFSLWLALALRRYPVPVLQAYPQG
jgi:hypothetical protein